MPKCLANAQKLDPKWSNVTSSQPIMLWRIKFEVNPTNSRQLCRTDRSHFWQDFYDTKFRSEFGVWQQYSPRRLHYSLPSRSLSGLKYKSIFWLQALLFRSLKHRTIFQTLLDILVGIKEKSNCFKGFDCRASCHGLEQFQPVDQKISLRLTNHRIQICRYVEREAIFWSATYI